MQTQEQQLLTELRKRSKLKGEARFISYRELESPPFYFNSPSKPMSEALKKGFFVKGGRNGKKAPYIVFRIEEKGEKGKYRWETVEEFVASGQKRDDYITLRLKLDRVK